jgi:7-carboxy-7-deazaguanine synthase
MTDPTRLRITEIFYSLQGESATIGYPTVFIRLTGCPLRCGYCDTEYAFQGGEWMSQDEIIEQVRQYNTRHVTVTGGEPLAQKNCLLLLGKLCDAGYNVSLETSGALDVSGVDKRVIKVVDLKTPASGEAERNLYDNIDKLLPHDQVKFVICDRADFDWSVDTMNRYQLTDKCEVVFSPAFGTQDATELADWVLAAQLPVRMQVQLHKYLWGNEPGR